MIVIADTTPLNHLILIDQVSLLRALYGRVIVPQAVFSELQDEWVATVSVLLIVGFYVDHARYPSGKRT